jgi:hypothetical protein
MKNYDNADLGICALLLLGVGALATGHAEEGLMGAIVAAVAGIARPNGNKNGSEPPKPPSG